MTEIFLKTIGPFGEDANFVFDCVYHLGCISLVNSKIGLLRELSRILFCERRNKKSKKGLIAD